MELTAESALRMLLHLNPYSLVQVALQSKPALIADKSRLLTASAVYDFPQCMLIPWPSVCHLVLLVLAFGIRRPPDFKEIQPMMHKQKFESEVHAETMRIEAALDN